MKLYMYGLVDEGLQDACVIFSTGGSVGQYFRVIKLGVRNVYMMLFLRAQFLELMVSGRFTLDTLVRSTFI